MSRAARVQAESLSACLSSDQRKGGEEKKKRKKKTCDNALRSVLGRLSWEAANGLSAPRLRLSSCVTPCIHGSGMVEPRCADAPKRKAHCPLGWRAREEHLLKTALPGSHSSPRPDQPMIPSPPSHPRKAAQRALIYCRHWPRERSVGTSRDVLPSMGLRGATLETRRRGRGKRENEKRGSGGPNERAQSRFFVERATLLASISSLRVSVLKLLLPYSTIFGRTLI